MIKKTDNCSLMGAEIPLSSEFFKVIKNELWLYLVPAALAVLLLALFLEEVGFFLRHVPSSRHRCLSLWILGMYPVESFDPNIYVNAVIGVSTFMSYYGYLLFYKATRRALHGYGLRAKFVCIIVVLVLCGLQNGILETMGALKVVPCAPPFSALFRSQLIYHYSVIVEMFCISLFARNIFRKVEPSPEDAYGLEERIISHKEVQTETQLPFAVQLSSQAEETWCSNPGYSSDSEDSLCKIEHAPLDHFPFPLQSMPLDLSERDSKNQPDEYKTTDPTTIIVSAEINYVVNNDVTVV
ncbi:organic solute transporter subunit alpha-like [Silurus asotus]|uniref:Organic solute transporter subunit alpha-like n=1 Tax=Silurus asotus TaxID=30991 RepID=A0AAD5ACW2_SILAS|nr:organic solute transporter subunit alpha-like [Silurus asotus]